MNLARVKAGMNHSAQALVVAVLAGLAGTARADIDEPVVRLSEPVRITAEFETYGAPLPEGLPRIDLGKLIDGNGRHLDSDVIVVARVAQVCRKKGCFFVAQDGPYVVRVSFLDYGFFVPTDIDGRTVTLAGKLQQRELSAQQAEHYGEDTNGQARFRAGPQYEIVATSVRVPRR